MTTKETTSPEQKEKEDMTFSLVLWNDDHNSFEYVVDCVYLICKYPVEQAVQCATIAHHKGKYAICSDSYERIKRLHEKFSSSTTLTTTIESK